MTPSRLIQGYLVVSGGIVLLFGLVMALAPVFLYAQDGATLDPDPTLLNNARASGGAFVMVGVSILAGAFVEELRLASGAFAPLAYAVLGGARVVGAVVDGLPSPTLLAATGFNFAVAAIGLALLANYRRSLHGQGGVPPADPGKTE